MFFWFSYAYGKSNRTHHMKYMIWPTYQWAHICTSWTIKMDNTHRQQTWTICMDSKLSHATVIMIRGNVVLPYTILSAHQESILMLYHSYNWDANITLKLCNALQPFKFDSYWYFQKYSLCRIYIYIHNETMSIASDNIKNRLQSQAMCKRILQSSVPIFFDFPAMWPTDKPGRIAYQAH